MNHETQEVGSAITGSLTDMWNRIIGFIPEILAALLVLILGYFIARGVAALVRKTLQLTRIDRIGQEMGIHKYLRERDIDFSFAGSIAWLSKWIILLAFIVAAIDILGIPQMSAFIGSIIAYIPNVILAVAILSVGFIAAHYISSLVESSTRVSRTLRNYSPQLGMLSSGAIIAFALMAALIQLGIAANLITILFAGLVGMLALAGGLAFGLGGRKNARRILDRFQLEAAESDDLYLTEETQETIREDVPNCLLGMEFPANKKAVVTYCQDSKAKDLLRNLEERDYFSLADIIRGLRRSFSG